MTATVVTEATVGAHRSTRLGPSPFGRTLPGVLVAAVFGVACLVWLIGGTALPGGRWIVVHLFTLGVLTVLIWTFTAHFATTFAAGGAQAPTRGMLVVRTLALAASIVTMLVGRVLGLHLAVVIGSVGIMLAVASNLLVLRALQERASTTRFLWVVRRYRDAHLAFLAAAALGGALGAGWIPGSLFVAVRDAHIHLNVLGWGGLTVLATLVVFGPALLRTRLDPRDEARAAAGSQVAVLGLLVAAGGFVVTSLGDGAGPARLLTVGGLSAYGYGVAVVAWPLLEAARRTVRSPLRWLVGAALLWFGAVIVADLAMAVVGGPNWSYGRASMVLLGAFAQLIIAVVSYLAPMYRGRDLATRDLLLARVEAIAPHRAVAFNLGVLLLATSSLLASASGLAVAAIRGAGWLVLGVAVAAQLAPLVWPARPLDPDRVYSATAARYRSESRAPSMSGRGSPPSAA